MARFGFGGFIIAYAVSAALWSAAACRRFRFPFAASVTLALLLRSAMLFAPPLLSADVYRYMVDGRTLASGRNPYAVLPDDPRVNHPETPTIYPPHAEILFAAVHQLTAWRVLLIACDLAALFMLRGDALAIATFPPLIFEGAWNGHVESVAALLLLVAWRRRSAVAAALAVGMKVIPIAAVPALSARSNRVRWLTIFALTLLVPAVPFIAAGPFMPGMRAYATRWIFNSPAYDLARFAAAHAHLKDVWTATKGTLHAEGIAPLVYRHLYDDFVARALLAIVAVALIVRFRRDPLASIGALLLCSPAIHPWYWIVLVPLAFELRSRGWLAVAICAPFSYLLYAGVPTPLVYLLCYGVPVAVATARLRPSATASSAASGPCAAIPPHTARGTFPT